MSYAVVGETVNPNNINKCYCKLNNVIIIHNTFKERPTSMLSRSLFSIDWMACSLDLFMLGLYTDDFSWENTKLLRSSLH